MVLRKIIIDNSVRYIPKIKQTREINQNTIKNKSSPRNTNISQNSKKFLKNVATCGFAALK